MAAFRAWLACADTTPACYLAEQFAADEGVSGGSRMREWRLSCAIGQRQLA